MPAAQHDFLIERYATFSKALAISNGGGNSFDLTGWMPRMHIRSAPESQEILCELDEESGRLTIANPASGVLSLYLSAAETTDLDWDSGRYDLTLTHAQTGERRRILEGTVTVSPGVTR